MSMEKLMSHNPPMGIKQTVSSTTGDGTNGTNDDKLSELALRHYKVGLTDGELDAIVTNESAVPYIWTDFTESMFGDNRFSHDTVDTVKRRLRFNGFWCEGKGVPVLIWDSSASIPVAIADDDISERIMSVIDELASEKGHGKHASLYHTIRSWCSFSIMRSSNAAYVKTLLDDVLYWSGYLLDSDVWPLKKPDVSYRTISIWKARFSSNQLYDGDIQNHAQYEVNIALPSGRVLQSLHGIEMLPTSIHGVWKWRAVNWDTVLMLIPNDYNCNPTDYKDSIDYNWFQNETNGSSQNRIARPKRASNGSSVITRHS